MDILEEKRREFRSIFQSKGVKTTILSLKLFLIEPSESFRTLMLIESQYKQARNREQRGIIDYEKLSVEKNSIGSRLLDFIEDFVWEDTRLSVFTDSRDGQEYRTIRFNGQIWMADNLNYNVGEGCWVHEHDPVNSKKYGRLYNWDAGTKACPLGWRLPSDKDWQMIAKNFGGYYDFLDNSYDVGNPQEGLQNLLKGGRSKFNAVLAGYYSPSSVSSESFWQVDTNGLYWTASELDSEGGILYNFDKDMEELYRGTDGKSIGCACRCIKDY